jgi:hypothetical protein
MDAHVHARRFFFLKKYRQKYPLLPSLQPSEAGEMHFEEEIRSRGPKDHEAQESFPRRHYPDRVRGYLLSPALSGAPLFQLFPLNHFLRRTANAAGFCPETDAKIDSQKPEKTRVNRGCRPSYRVPIFFLKIAAIFPSWAIQYERNFYSPHLEHSWKTRSLFKRRARWLFLEKKATQPLAFSLHPFQKCDTSDCSKSTPFFER